MFNMVIGQVCSSVEKQANLFNEIFPECNMNENVISESEEKTNKNKDTIQRLESALNCLENKVKP